MSKLELHDISLVIAMILATTIPCETIGNFYRDMFLQVDGRLFTHRHLLASK